MFPRYIFVVILLFFYSFVLEGYAGAKVLKVSYVENPFSVRSLKLLKMVAPSPDWYNKIVNAVSSSRIYYSLYVQLETGESLLYLDSVKVDPNLMMAGYMNGVYANKQNEYQASELWNNTKLFFKATEQDFKWQIFAEESKVIGEVSAVKAKLDIDPDLESVIWVDLSMPVKIGPDYYLNPPGLVLEMENFWRSIYATKKEYLSDEVEMETKKNKFLSDIQNKTFMPVKKVLDNKKVNLLQVMHNINKYQSEH